MKLKHAILLFLPLVSGRLLALEDDDFWLMLEAPADSSFYISSGLDTDSGLSMNIQLEQKLGEQIYINGGWSRLNLQEDTRSWSLGLSGDPYGHWLWSWNLLNWGEPGLIESRDHEIRLQTFYHNWNILLGVQQGDAHIDFFRALRSGQTSASTDHQALILGAGYNGSSIYWQFETRHHEYDRDLSPLANNKRLLLFIEPSALQQSTALNKQADNLTLGYIVQDYNGSLQFNRFQSAVSGEWSRFINLGLQISLTPLQELGFSLIIPLNNGVSSLGVSWLQRW